MASSDRAAPARDDIANVELLSAPPAVNALLPPSTVRTTGTTAVAVSRSLGDIDSMDVTVVVEDSIGVHRDSLTNAVIVCLPEAVVAGCMLGDAALCVDVSVEEGLSGMLVLDVSVRLTVVVSVADSVAVISCSVALGVRRCKPVSVSVIVDVSVVLTDAVRVWRRPNA